MPLWAVQEMTLKKWSYFMLSSVLHFLCEPGRQSWDTIATQKYCSHRYHPTITQSMQHLREDTCKCQAYGVWIFVLWSLQKALMMALARLEVSCCDDLTSTGDSSESYIFSWHKHIQHFIVIMVLCSDSCCEWPSGRWNKVLVLQNKWGVRAGWKNRVSCRFVESFADLSNIWRSFHLMCCDVLCMRSGERCGGERPAYVSWGWVARPVQNFMEGFVSSRIFVHISCSYLRFGGNLILKHTTFMLLPWETSIAPEQDWLWDYHLLQYLFTVWLYLSC